MAHIGSKGVRYYGYAGIGTGFGGFYAKTPVGYTDGSSSDEVDLVINNGIAAGGFAGLLQFQAGAEWRFPSHLYLAVEANGNVAFNETRQSAYFNHGNSITISIHSANSSGSNAFAGLYAAGKIGWTDGTDSVAFYFILGAGYEFSPAVLGANIGSGASSSSSSYDIDLGGGRLQYGVGSTYYFNDNFGIYFNFVLTSPIPQGKLSGETIMGSNPPKLHLDAGVSSFSYILNLGLSVRF